MRQLLKILKALSDPNRMRIMKLLQKREMCVCELAEVLGISQPSVSRHMRLLVDADLLVSRREGVWIYYLWNPSPSHHYATCLLESVSGWLENDSNIRALLKRAAKIKRENICRRSVRNRPQGGGKGKSK